MINKQATCMKKIFCFILLTVCILQHEQVAGQIWNPDNGNGTYKNPILYADFSDPDVIRTGDDYYMVASSFTCQPGIPVLHSKDLVNWKIINYVYRTLPFNRYEKPAHGQGSWAPSIRYHEGKYYVYFCTPEEGLFMATTSHPAKPWKLHHVQDVAQWEDPCPFWDDDGNAYLIRGILCGYPAIIHRMSADGTRLLDNGTTVYEDREENPVLEGFKMMKRNGYYYIFAPAGGVAAGWQTILRSKNIYGPYEAKKVLQEGNGINGPHQGGFVDTPSGEWWFLHFQDRDFYGRVVHLQPGGWKNDWPVMGIDINNDGIGEPVLSHKKPDIHIQGPSFQLQTDDEFNHPELGLQWQWQAAPQTNWYSLTANKGHIRLVTEHVPTEYGNLYYAPNLLLQKLTAPAFTAITKVNFNGVQTGEKAGLTIMGNKYSFICIQKTTNGNRIGLYEGGYENCGSIPLEIDGINIKEQPVWLKVEVSEKGLCRYAYSMDGASYNSFKHTFKIVRGRWIGAKVGIFCLNPNIVKSNGYADFDFFRLTPP